MPTHSVYLVTVSLFEQGPGRSGRQLPSTEFYHTVPHHTIPMHLVLQPSTLLSLILSGAGTQHVTNAQVDVRTTLLIDDSPYKVLSMQPQRFLF